MKKNYEGIGVEIRNPETKLERFFNGFALGVVIGLMVGMPMGVFLLIAMATEPIH